MNQARSAGPGHPWQGGPGDVNLFSLSKQVSVPLINWQTVGGFPMHFSLAHNSQSVIPNPALGSKWQHTFGTSIYRWRDGGGSKLGVLFGDHHIRMFALVGPNWVPQDGYRDSIVQVGSNFELTLANQTKLVFHPTILGPRDTYYRLASISRHGTTANLLYNSSDHLLRVQEPSGRALRFNYAGLKIGSVDFLVNGNPQRTWTFSYDGLGRLVQVQLPPVTTDIGVQSHAHTFTYNSLHNLATTTSPEGLTTQYGYVGNDIAFEQWPGNSLAERVLYARSGVVRTVADPLGHTTEYQYDSQSRLVRSTDAASATTTVEYLDPNYAFAPSRVTSPSGDVVRYEYDARGNTVARLDPAGNQWDYTYDARNNLVMVLNPLVTDAWGMVQPGRGRIDYVYDANDRLVEHRLYSSLTMFGQTTYTYDGVGNLTLVTNPLSKTWTYSYDTFGNPTQIVSPVGRVVRYHYDAVGQTAGFVAPNAVEDSIGVRTEYDRDEWGRVRVIDFPALPNFEYRYDGLDRLVRTVGPEGTTTYAYDSAGLLASTVDGPEIVQYQYDAAGRLTTLFEGTASGSRTIGLVRDPRGLPTTINDAGGLNTFAYDGDQRLVSRTFANGAETFFDYFNGRVRTITHEDSANNPFFVSVYSYQSDGRVAQVNEPGGAVTRYGYDFSGRLGLEDRAGAPLSYNHRWSYDAAGNRINQDQNGNFTVYIYDADNRLVTTLGADQSTYTYDANGRLQRRVRGPQDAIFAYDPLGRMTGIQQRSGPSYVPLSEYTYDALGRVKTRTIDVAGINRVYNFLYSGSDVMRADWIRGVQTGTQVTTWGPGGLLHLSDIAFPQYSGSPATDAAGNGRWRTFPGGGLALYQAVYNAFGEEVFVDGSPSPYGFGADMGIRRETESEAGFIRSASTFYEPGTRMIICGPMAAKDHSLQSSRPRIRLPKDFMVYPTEGWNNCSSNMIKPRWMYPGVLAPSLGEFSQDSFTSILPDANLVKRPQPGFVLPDGLTQAEADYYGLSAKLSDPTKPMHAQMQGFTDPATGVR